MDFKREKIIPYYVVVVVFIALAGLAVVGKAGYTMFVKRAFWNDVSKRLVTENVPIKPSRGNILSSDGQIIASSLPEFKMYLDFHANADSAHRAKAQHKKDSILFSKLDSMTRGLHAIFPDRSVQDFRKCITDGYKAQSRHWLIYDHRVSFTQYKKVKSLAYFKESRGLSGFHVDTFNMRKKPFGSLASRTVGDIFGRLDSARNGLELCYDSILKGIPGRSHRKKVRSRWIPIVDQNPVDGYDLVTTLDVGMQDVAEQSLVRKLKEVNGEMGIVILMEAKTGDVKAIVNMTRCADGEFREVMNNAVANLREPGSTFKTASIMVALDDGVIDTTDHVDACNGQYMMHGRVMKDHNWRRGGYQILSVPEVLMFSSNVGVSRLIDEHYSQDPAKYVRGLYRVGIAEDLHLPLVGAAHPRVRIPKRNPKRKTEWLNWSATALPWMSIGYETQIPPINTCAFYNAIANGGTMVRPKFVKSIMQNGEVVRNFPPEVIKEQICKPTTLSKIQAILRRVVRDGLGKRAGNKMFPVSGKTGTAQVSQGSKGYKAGGTSYFVSFCGFFPSDAPKYTCYVAILKNGLPASGGTQCGPVFKDVSEAVMSKQSELRLYAKDARDTVHVFAPVVKNGDLGAADYVLSQLGIQHTCNGLRPWREQQTGWNKLQEGMSSWDGHRDNRNPVWGTAHQDANSVSLSRVAVTRGIVPDVTGMGAKDAVYLLEKCGLRVRLRGFGFVTQQSLPFGHRIVKNELIQIVLEQHNLDIPTLPKPAAPSATGNEEVVDESGGTNGAPQPAAQTEKTSNAKDGAVSAAKDKTARTAPKGNVEKKDAVKKSVASDKSKGENTKTGNKTSKEGLTPGKKTASKKSADTSDKKGTQSKKGTAVKKETSQKASSGKQSSSDKKADKKQKSASPKPKTSKKD
jgi:cell division protein FtsI (penicillin-binding protein 3)